MSAIFTKAPYFSWKVPVTPFEVTSIMILAFSSLGKIGHFSIIENLGDVIENILFSNLSITKQEHCDLDPPTSWPLEGLRSMLSGYLRAYAGESLQEVCDTYKLHEAHFCIQETTGSAQPEQASIDTRVVSRNCFELARNHKEASVLHGSSASAA